MKHPLLTTHTTLNRHHSVPTTGCAIEPENLENCRFPVEKSILILDFHGSTVLQACSTCDSLNLEMQLADDAAELLSLIFLHHLEQEEMGTYSQAGLSFFLAHVPGYKAVNPAILV